MRSKAMIFILTFMLGAGASSLFEYSKAVKQMKAAPAQGANVTESVEYLRRKPMTANLVLYNDHFTIRTHKDNARETKLIKLPSRVGLTPNKKYLLDTDKMVIGEYGYDEKADNWVLESEITLEGITTETPKDGR